MTISEEYKSIFEKKLFKKAKVLSSPFLRFWMNINIIHTATEFPIQLWKI